MQHKTTSPENESWQCNAIQHNNECLVRAQLFLPFVQSFPSFGFANLLPLPLSLSAFLDSDS